MTLQSRQETARTLLRAAGVLPILTVDSEAQALAIAEALARGGLTTIEITLRSPVALAAIAAVKRAHPQLHVGAGTVLTLTQLRNALDAGAQFIVTPGTPPALAEALAQAPVPVIPGAASPTELMALSALGFSVAKLFPVAAIGGLAMIQALRGPLPHLGLSPSGGIEESALRDYLIQPNVLCVGGSWMLKAEWLGRHDYDAVAESAKRTRALVDDLRMREGVNKSTPGSSPVG